MIFNQQKAADKGGAQRQKFLKYQNQIDIQRTKQQVYGGNDGTWLRKVEKEGEEKN